MSQERYRISPSFNWKWLRDDPEVLGILHYGAGLTQSEIARRSRVKQPTVSKRFKKWGIETLMRDKINFPDEAGLIERVCKKWGRYDLAAEELGVSTFWLWRARKRHGTPDLPRGRKPTWSKMTKEMEQQAARLYQKEAMSTGQIAVYLQEQFGVKITRETVRCHLKRQGVLRSRMAALQEHFEQRRQSSGLLKRDHQLMQQRDVLISEVVNTDGVGNLREIPREIIGGDERSLGWETMVVPQSAIRARYPNDNEYSLACHNPWEFLGE